MALLSHRVCHHTFGLDGGLSKGFAVHQRVAIIVIVLASTSILLISRIGIVVDHG